MISSAQPLQPKTQRDQQMQYSSAALPLACLMCSIYICIMSCTPNLVYCTHHCKTGRFLFKNHCVLGNWCMQYAHTYHVTYGSGWYLPCCHTTQLKYYLVKPAAASDTKFLHAPSCKTRHNSQVKTTPARLVLFTRVVSHAGIGRSQLCHMRCILRVLQIKTIKCNLTTMHRHA
jgi:hypothetical protein